MRAISSNETARKRTHVTPKRATTAVVMRPTLSDDGAGGFTDSPTTVGTYSARVAPNTDYNFPMELIKAGEMKSTSVWAIGFPVTADVQVQDYIESGGATFEVVGVNNEKEPLTEILALCYKVE